jgi:hypothetical protein
MASRADQMNQLSGTLAIGGSLSQTIDLEGWNVGGLIISPTSGTLVPGSIQFRVSADNSNFVPLNDGTNTRVAIPFGTTAVAYTATVLSVIMPFRFVKVETTSVQGNGAKVTFAVKLY